jgi:uncharacterized membrane protein
MIDVIQIILIVLGPMFFLVFQNNKVICSLSPVVCCYVLGIIFANIPGIDVNSAISKMATEASVPLAIPLLLFGTHFIKWFRLAKSTVLSFVLIVVTVCFVSIVVSLFFKEDLPNYWQLAGMMVGVYTGGTPNLTAIGLAVGASESDFILMNGADLLLGAAYLLFILTFGLKLIGKILPAFKFTTDNSETIAHSPWSTLSSKVKAKNSILMIISSGVILGISLGLSQLFFGKDNVGFIILVITTLGIALSFKSKIREFIGSYEVGQYLLLVFCVGIGTMANIQELSNGSLLYVSFLGSVMVLSIFIHLLLCAFFKIDRDTAIITSVAGIFGPPFVGPVAQRLQNREIVVSGLTSGLVGYAIGNYLGLAVAYFVKSL